MFRNYVLTAWRNLMRNRLYSVINIAGLTLGITCVMLIVLYVKDEVSYDRFHKGVENIYRVTAGSTDPRAKGMRDWGISGFIQGPRFTADVPGIATFVRVGHSQTDVRTAGGVGTIPYLYADSNFFTVFTFPLLSGDPKTALASPNGVVLSEDAARQYFGTTEAVGKLLYLKFNDTVFRPYAVTAVAKRAPQNSSITFDMITKLKQPADLLQDEMGWFNFMLNTYVVLNPHADRSMVAAGMTRAYRRDAGVVIAKMEKQYQMKDQTYYGLQRFVDMHLGKNVTQEGVTNASNPIYAYILTGISIFILLIAAINFINLSVARSLKRAKEIGVRKVLGGARRELMLQFLGEAFLLCAIAFTAAIALTQLILPLFDRLSNKALSFSYLLDARLIILYVGLLLLTGLLAGFYPALVISGFHPVKALYSRAVLSGRGWLQKGLVVLQFGLASFLIMGTFVIYSQFHFLTTEKLGYDDRGLVLVDKSTLTRQEARLFREELMKDPDIVGVAAKDEGYSFNPAKVNGDSTIGFTNTTVDESFLPLLQIPLVAGRNFSGRFPSDSSHSVIVNEQFVKKAGWKHPIGELVDMGDAAKYSVIGVVKDYHFESLAKEIQPEILTMRMSADYGMVYIKLRPGPSAAALRYIETTFRKLFPMYPYSYVFKDQQNLADYALEAKWKQIILFGAILTIFISCIGLFGLSFLAAERRTKEIGIRKVLGATVASVVRILSLDFLKLVAIGLLLAIPLAVWRGDAWLANYSYRISLNAWMAAAAGIVVIAVALLTVSLQAIRAGRANPVKSLRVD